MATIKVHDSQNDNTIEVLNLSDTYKNEVVLEMFLADNDIKDLQYFSFSRKEAIEFIKALVKEFKINKIQEL